MSQELGPRVIDLAMLSSTHEKSRLSRCSSEKASSWEQRQWSTAAVGTACLHKRIIYSPSRATGRSEGPDGPRREKILEHFVRISGEIFDRGLTPNQKWTVWESWHPCTTENAQTVGFAGQGHRDNNFLGEDHIDVRCFTFVASPKRPSLRPPFR